MTIQHATPAIPAVTDAVAPIPAGRSPADWAHVLAFGAIGWPWLLRSLSGGPPEARAALLEKLGLPDDALPPLGGWRADAGFLHAVADRILARRPEQVVELGGGTSTIVAATALRMAGHGQLLSLDHDSGFATATGAELARLGLEAELRCAPLGPSPADWPGRWYDHGPLPARIDLLIVDGPPWAIHPFVRGAAETLFDRVPVGGAVLLDDAARPGERVVAGRWRRRWPGFRFTLTRDSGKGLLVGERLS